LQSVNNRGMTIQTADWKKLLKMRNEVSWKWVDAAGFEFDVKGTMRDPNVIQFMNNGKLVALERKEKVVIPQNN